MRSVAAMLDEDMDEDCEIEDKKERGAVEYLNYEGDGIFDNIYEVLWTKQEGGKGIEIVVPDTVVFKFNKPTGWYYTKITRSSALRLHKKRFAALRVGLILQHFTSTSAQSCSDIVAYYISQSEVDAEHGQRASHIHYLAKSELEHFLLHTKNKSGILQRFVDPKPSTSHKYHNSLVRCTWSQSVCLVERRTNVHDLKPKSSLSRQNPHLTRYDRAETFEGDFRNSTEYPLTSAKLLEQIQTVCQRIVNHFLGVACGKLAVSRMVINLKFDSDTRLHFLWCESLRLERKKHPVTGAHLAPPPTVIGGDQAFNLANKLKLPPKEMQREEFAVCKFCTRSMAADGFVEAEYHTLLAAYDEISLSGQQPSAHSGPIMRLRSKWRKVEELAAQTTSGQVPDLPNPLSKTGGRFASRPWSEKRQRKKDLQEEPKPADSGVAIDESSFTQPMNMERGLLAHVDERQLHKDPLAALAQATREWGERNQRRKMEPQNDQGQERSPKHQSKEFQGIPWFVTHLHPYITPKDWLHARNRSDFQRIKVSMCDSCYVTLVAGLASEDTLRQHHSNMSRRPRLSATPQFRRTPVPASTRTQTKISRTPRRRLLGLSRLLVPCNVHFGDSASPASPFCSGPQLHTPEGSDAGKSMDSLDEEQLRERFMAERAATCRKWDQKRQSIASRRSTNASLSPRRSLARAVGSVVGSVAGSPAGSPKAAVAPAAESPTQKAGFDAPNSQTALSDGDGSVRNARLAKFVSTAMVKVRCDAEEEAKKAAQITIAPLFDGSTASQSPRRRARSVNCTGGRYCRSELLRCVRSQRKHSVGFKSVRSVTGSGLPPLRKRSKTVNSPDADSPMTPR